MSRIGHEQGRDSHLPDAYESYEEHILHAHAYRFAIACDTANNAADFGFVEKRQWQPLQMGEDFAANIVNHRFAQFERESLAKMKSDLREERHPHHSQSSPQNLLRGGLLLNQAINDRGDTPGDGRQLHRSQDNADQKGIAFPSVGTHVLEQSQNDAYIERPLFGLVVVIGFASG
jgi:hypothetical protein